MDEKWKVAANVLSCRFDDEVVLMNFENEEYYGLEFPGSRIWELLELPRSLAEICSLLVEEYDVDTDICHEETSEFVQNMIDKNLVEKFSGEDKTIDLYWLSTGVKIHFDSNRNIYFKTKEEEFQGDYLGLPILSAFGMPTSIGEAVRKLSTAMRGKEEWKILTAAIKSLVEAGILVKEEENGAKVVVHGILGDFDYPYIHIKMLNDSERTGNYVAAIRESVRPGDIVVDLGTGTGVLAIAAAQAGAAHVYAVESGEMMAQIARENVARNGFQDKITVLQGWSTHIDLPQKADILISEIIGNEPLGEHVIGYTTDAVQRWLKPDARLLPSK